MARESIRVLKLDGRPVNVFSAYLDDDPAGWRIEGRAHRLLARVAGRRTVEASLEDGSTFLGVGLVKTSLIAVAGITMTVLEIIRAAA